MFKSWHIFLISQEFLAKIAMENCRKYSFCSIFMNDFEFFLMIAAVKKPNLKKMKR